MMLQPYTYLLINFFTILICFIASFDKRLQFHKQFGPFLLAATIVAIPFIAWDVWFTAHGVWWFNTDYTTGLIIAGLPIEEWLFFFCIPFSCVFTYFCLEKFFDWPWASAFNNVIVFVSIIVCAVVGLLHTDKMYTLVTAIATILTLVYLHFIAKKEWISRASLTFLILMPGFFGVNGILTGTGLASPIVNYNPDEFLGIRMLTIPVEDAVYGYAQFLLVLYFFKIFQKKPIHEN
ncbi:lycopene cyclase domain-containing protein [Paenimyroides aestuarii]|uniref:Lycopene cyclase domain-containing protein n=1 Tax=Paenimyroides aestuarii TaxID=2968490 RepID=A0ABY5NUI3_9FLAO|nr:lycopene cyclase domain-containing protein [Paenimyroides aestuarii]UUV22004.1 lycopene cyclase domain-containing protein [Paenimyroides aestuarii]